MAKKHNLRDTVVRDTVVDMASAFGIEYEEDANEICFTLPEKIGSGFVKATSFDYGVGVITADYTLNNPMEFKMDEGILQPLKLIFNRESSFTHMFKGVDELHEIKRLESVIVACNKKHGHIFKIPANEPICIFSIDINRKLFEEKIQSFLAEMNEELEHLFRDVNGINLFFSKSHFSLDIAKFIEEFTECELEGFMRSVYLEGKTYEILTHHLRQYLDDLNEPDSRTILRQSTVDSVEKAANIIKQEIDSLENIPSLAKRVGLNQNTLQSGFKYLYKISVNEFIRDYRIDKAKDLIENSELNITEITYKIGINSRSYFSKLFKEKYGVTPKQYLEKKRNNSDKAS